MFGRKGSTGGNLTNIPTCIFTVPGAGSFQLKVVPTISDSKSANYASQTIYGRSNPVRSYSESGPRTITIGWSVFNTDEDIENNIKLIRAIQASVHPKYQYDPPPICKLQCGKLLSSGVVDVLVTNYKFNYSNDCVYNDDLIPFQIDIDLDLEVAYSQANLPGFNDVYPSGNF